MKKHRRAIKLLLLLTLAAGLNGCGAPTGKDSAASVTESGYDQPELHRIKITEEDEKFYAVLFDNGPAQDFSDQLPLTVPLWVPADFAKAFDLENELSEELTREYQGGGLAYWPAGPSVAIIHGTEPERTAVPVVIMGKLEGDASFFVDYNGTITIEEAE